MHAYIHNVTSYVPYNQKFSWDENFTHESRGGGVQRRQKISAGENFQLYYCVHMVIYMYMYIYIPQITIIIIIAIFYNFDEFAGPYGDGALPDASEVKEGECEL